MDDKKPTILLLEDESGFRALLKEILDGADYNVIDFGIAEEAMDALAENDVDLILLDHYLPGITGLDFLGQLREKGDETPAIVMTISDDLPTVVSAIRVQAVDFLRKPFGAVEELLPAIRKCLAKTHL